MDERPKLSPEAAEARRAYQRRWRAENREKCREYQRKHWERVALKSRKENTTDE